MSKVRINLKIFQHSAECENIIGTQKAKELLEKAKPRITAKLYTGQAKD